MPNTTKIVDELELRRKRLGMSRRILAERTGLGIATVTRILTGRGDLRLQTLLRLAETLGMDVTVSNRDRARDMRDRQARAKAHRLVGITQGSSALEGQAVDAKAVRRMEREIADELLVGPRIRLWS